MFLPPLSGAKLFFRPWEPHVINGEAPKRHHIRQRKFDISQGCLKWTSKEEGGKARTGGGCRGEAN